MSAGPDPVSRRTEEEHVPPTPTPTPTPAPAPARPVFDPVAFILGAAFVLVAVLGLLDPELTADVDLGLLAPAALVVVGGALLLGSTLSGRRRRPDASRTPRPGGPGGPPSR